MFLELTRFLQWKIDSCSKRNTDLKKIFGSLTPVSTISGFASVYFHYN